jgi:hypothetical protein
VPWGSTWTDTLSTWLDSEDGQYLFIRWIEQNKPTNRLQYSAILDLGDRTVEITQTPRPEGKDWTRPYEYDAAGKLGPGDRVYSSNFTRGEHVELTFSATPNNVLFEVASVTLAGSIDIPFTFTPDRIPWQRSAGTVSFTMPEFTSPDAWVSGTVQISFRGEHWPRRMTPLYFVSENYHWDSMTELNVGGYGMEQVKGHGDFSSFTPDEQAVLKRVTLKNGFSGIEVVVPDELISDNGLTITLSPELKAALGAVPPNASFELTLTMGGVAMSRTVSTRWSFRATPYGMLAVTYEGTGSDRKYALIPADTEAELQERAAAVGQQVLMRIVGQTDYDHEAGGYVFSDCTVLVHNLFTYDLTAGGTFTARAVSQPKTVTLSGIGGKGSFPGMSAGSFNTLSTTLLDGVTSR